MSLVNTPGALSPHLGTPIPEPEVPEGVDVLRDIAFGPHERQCYDVYLPRDRARPLPVVAFFHPGAWSRRDKRAVRLMFALEHGYALVSIGYRLAQHAPFPAQIQDANQGLRHMLSHAADYGIDPARLVLTGTSAGAHLASLAALAHNVAAFDPVEGLAPCGVVAVYGAYDMPALIDGQAQIETDHSSADSPLGKMLGGLPADHRDGLIRMSPQTYVRPGAPPFHILHGIEDHVLPWTQSAGFAAALARSGVPVWFDPVPGVGHGHEAFRAPPVSDKIMAFIRRVTGQAG